MEVRTNLASHAEQKLRDNDFQNAIETFQLACETNPKDSELRGRYVRALEEIRMVADAAFDRRDFSLAGTVYEILWTNYPRYVKWAPGLTFDRDLLDRRRRTSQILLIVGRAEEKLKEKDFSNAIETFQLMCESNPSDPELRTRYTRALEQIRVIADEAFDRKEFSPARTVYEILWTNYPRYVKWAPLLSFDRDYLRRRIKASQNFPLRKQSQDAFLRGDYHESFRILQTGIARDPKDPVLKSQYVENMEWLREQADQAFGRQDYSRAGTLFEILLKNYPVWDAPPRALSFNTNFLNQRIRAGRNALLQKQAIQFLAVFDYERAIDVYRKPFELYRQDPQFRRNYFEILESIKTKGDEAFEKKDYAPAANAYRTFLKHYATALVLDPNLSANPKDLDRRVKSCKKALSEKALQDYRSGDLEQAIAIWKSVLTFDPEDAEIKKAVETATLQMESLKKTR